MNKEAKLKIIPKELKLCPQCGEILNLMTEANEGDTVCGCGYIEPNSSAFNVSKISNYISEYMLDLGMETIQFGKSALPMSLAMDGSAFLPLLVARAEQINQGLALGISNNGLNLNLSVIADEKGVLGQRVIAKNMGASGVTTLMLLAETMHEALDMTLAAEPNNTKSVRLDHTYVLVSNAPKDANNLLAQVQSQITATASRPA